MLAELACDICWPSRWDSRPIVAHLQDTRAAVRADAMASTVVIPGYEAVFTSVRPQTMMERALEAGLRPDGTVRAAPGSAWFAFLTS